MSDEINLIKVDLGEVAKPADTLIKKISNGIGGAFAASQVVRMAKAQAKADIISASAKVEVSDIQRRALQRQLAEETRNQSNIEQITANAIPLLEDKSKPENMEDDWIANFFERSRIVSDEEMQSLWSRLLADEANSPGSVSKRTVNVLSDLDKSDAEAFSTVCNFGWKIGGSYIPLVFKNRETIAINNGLSYELLGHLESLGLLRLAPRSEFTLHYPEGSHLPIGYFGHGIVLSVTPSPLKIGKVLLTRTGEQLARIASTGPIDGVFDYVHETYKARKQVVNATSGPVLSRNEK